jgi:hypothetical protein
MKQIVLTLGAIFLFANLAFGLVLDSFDLFNLLMSSGAIIFTTIILISIELIKMKDGFKVPLYVINSLCGIIEYIITLIAKYDMSNNWFYVVLIIVITFQLVFLSAAIITSKEFN